LGNSEIVEASDTNAIMMCRLASSDSFDEFHTSAARFSYTAGMRSVCILLVSAAFCTAHAANDPSLTRLQQQLTALARTTDGVVGVSATHIESGRSVSVRGAEGFPMASAFKIPIAIQILKLADEGKLRLDKVVTLTPADMHPGSGDLTDLFFHPGLALSIANLMEIALVISDNSAADVLLREAGGPEAVTARMKSLDLTGIRVDRSTAQLLADWGGVKEVPPEEQWSRTMWSKLLNAVPEKEHMAARHAQTIDPRDTARPDDMTRLMMRLWTRELLSRENSAVMLDMMARCQTGKTRLKGLLPAGTPVAHKTGSVGGVANDVGIITLPSKAGHVAISVFTKGWSGSGDQADRAIAEIARTVYDYFVFAPAGFAPVPAAPIEAPAESAQPDPQPVNQ
jgi:beta-lactamase class A